MRRCRKSHETKEHLPDVRSITEQRMKAVDGGQTQLERLCPWIDECWSPYGQGWAGGKGGLGGGCASTCWKGPAPPLWINRSLVWCSHSQTWLCMSHPGIQLKGDSEDSPAGPAVESTCQPRGRGCDACWSADHTCTDSASEDTWPAEGREEGSLAKTLTCWVGRRSAGFMALPLLSGSPVPRLQQEEGGSTSQVSV